MIKKKTHHVKSKIAGLAATASSAILSLLHPLEVIRFRRMSN